MTERELQIETQRRIGRNVINYNKLEHALKFITLPAKTLRGTPEELGGKLEREFAKIANGTMGGVWSLFVEQLKSPEVGKRTDLGTTGRQTGMRLKLGVSRGLRLRLEKLFSQIVEDRNRLIHGPMGELSPDSRSQREALNVRLDSENERIGRFMDELRPIVVTMRDAKRAWAEQLLKL